GRIFFEEGNQDLDPLVERQGCRIGRNPGEVDPEHIIVHFDQQVVPGGEVMLKSAAGKPGIFSDAGCGERAEPAVDQQVHGGAQEGKPRGVALPVAAGAGRGAVGHAASPAPVGALTACLINMTAGPRATLAIMATAKRMAGPSPRPPSRSARTATTCGPIPAP